MIKFKIMNSQQMKIIEKVQGLLALAQDNKNDAEGHSALLLAQKLMAKYNLTKKDVAEAGAKKEIYDYPITPYKQLRWWEKQLAIVIADNFRVKCYFRVKKCDEIQNKESCIIYYGTKDDWQLAQTLYYLALEQLQFYSSIQIKNQCLESYRLGFISGLTRDFNEQKNENKNLMVQSNFPAEIIELWANRSEQMKSTAEKIPTVKDLKAYWRGVDTGEKIQINKKKQEISNEN